MKFNVFFFRDIRSFANLLKSSLGSGILAMPAAFKNAGTIVGIFGTIMLGYICTHCVYLLVNLSFITQQKDLLNLDQNFTYAKRKLT